MEAPVVGQSLSVWTGDQGQDHEPRKEGWAARRKASERGHGDKAASMLELGENTSWPQEPKDLGWDIGGAWEAPQSGDNA